MPRPGLTTRATVFQLAALLALGWSAACASAGPALGFRPPASIGQAHRLTADLRWQAHGPGLAVVRAETLDDLDDDDERWKGLRLLAGLPARAALGATWVRPASELEPIALHVPPRGILSPRLRC